MQVPIATRRFVFIPMDLQDLSVGLLQVPNKQWGINTGGAVRTSTLPIPFTNVFLAVASTSSEWCCPGCSATNTTVTTRAYQSNRPDVAQPNDVNWIIIGCQPQWGYQTVHGTNPVTYDLPIPFEEAPFTVAISTGNSGNHASCGGFTKTTIVLRAGTTAGVWDTVGFFIIGCQLQWGENVGGGGQTVSLPISFEVAFTAVVSADSSWCNASCHITTTTITTMNYQSNKPDIAQLGPVQWLAIGIQPQWGNLWAGYTEVLNWYFPLTTSQVYAVCLTKHTKNISSGHNWEPARIEEWNNSYARIHPDGDLGYSVIAICKAQQQWGFSVTLSFESQLYYQHYPISFTVGPFTNILTTVSDEVNGVVYAPTTVNWYKDKFGIVCDYYSNGAYVKPTSVTFISLGI